MKKLISKCAIAAAVATISCSGLAANTMKPMTSTVLKSAMPQDLVLACVHTKSNHKICGYFSRKMLQSLPKKAHKDIYYMMHYPIGSFQ